MINDNNIENNDVFGFKLYLKVYLCLFCLTLLVPGADISAPATLARSARADISALAS